MHTVYDVGLTGQVTPVKHRPISTYNDDSGEMFKETERGVMDEVPKVLDWVKARAECSIDQLFIVLATVIEADTNAAKARADSSLTFEVSRSTTDTLLVIRNRNSGWIEAEAVAFQRLRDGSLAVRRRKERGPSTTDLFVAKPHVDVRGNCKFEVDGTPMEPWQVSKRALEDFFFEFGLSPKV